MLSRLTSYAVLVAAISFCFAAILAAMGFDGMAVNVANVADCVWTGSVISIALAYIFERWRGTKSI